MAGYRAGPDLKGGHLLRQRIEYALKAAPQRDLVQAAEGLLDVLGYRSERRPPEQSGRVDGFLDDYSADNPDTLTEREFRKNAQAVRILFQVTGDEIPARVDQGSFFETGGFDAGNAQSFMFAAVELSESSYARGPYARFTREINKRLSMPTVVLFRTAGGRLTLAFVHRRPHKFNPDRDVLGSVSLIREIDPDHRAHLDILAELSIDQRIRWMDARNLRHNFDGLLTAWLDALDTQELNKTFYGELFRWFNLAVKTASFPKNQRVTLSAEEHVIRLITRLLFVWFIKEKGLIANDLFIEERVGPLLKNYDRAKGDSYYRAVLQNLFFATLNTNIGRREFSKRNNATHRVFSRYRYENEISDSGTLLELCSIRPRSSTEGYSTAWIVRKPLATTATGSTVFPTIPSTGICCPYQIGSSLMKTGCSLFSTVTSLRSRRTLQLSRTWRWTRSSWVGSSKTSWPPITPRPEKPPVSSQAPTTLPDLSWTI